MSNEQEQLFFLLQTLCDNVKGIQSSAIVIMGSIIEMILILYYNINAKMENLIELARKDNINSKSDKIFLQILNYTRNYNQIYECIKSNDEITEIKFKNFFEFFLEFLNKFGNKFLEKEVKQNPHGLLKIQGSKDR